MNLYRLLVYTYFSAVFHFFYGSKKASFIKRTQPGGKTTFDCCLPDNRFHPFDGKCCSSKRQGHIAIGCWHVENLKNK